MRIHSLRRSARNAQDALLPQRYQAANEFRAVAFQAPMVDDRRHVPVDVSLQFLDAVLPDPGRSLPAPPNGLPSGDLKAKILSPARPRPVVNLQPSAEPVVLPPSVRDEADPIIQPQLIGPEQRQLKPIIFIKAVHASLLRPVWRRTSCVP